MLRTWKTRQYSEIILFVFTVLFLFFNSNAHAIPCEQPKVLDPNGGIKSAVSKEQSRVSRFGCPTSEPTMPTVPSAAPNPTSSGNYKVTWNWIPGSFPPTKYVLEENGTIVVNAFTKEYNASNKSNGLYTYKVKACNENGCSNLTSGHTVTVARKPGVPFGITAPSTDNNGAYTVTWGSASGGVSQYRLERKINSGGWSQIYAGTSRNLAQSGLSDGYYQYRVRACYTLNGFTSCSGYKTSVTTTVANQPGKPSSIGGVPSTSSSGTFTVSWSSTSLADNYRLEQKKDNGAWTQLYSGTSTSRALSGLSDGAYQYRTRACNSYGSYTACSDYQTSGTATVARTPGTPASISGIPSTDTNGAFTVSWGSSSGNVDSYILEQQHNSGSWTSKYSGSGLSKSISGLSDGSYRYRVRACNTVGSFTSCSGHRTSGTVTVVNTPGTPSSISVPSTDNDGALTVSWGSASGSVDNYELQQRSGTSWATIYSGSGRSKGISGLNDGSYRYRVRACNTVESFTSCSGFRESNDLTVAHTPGTPSSITVPGSDYDGAYTITWGNASGNVDAYRVEQKKNSGSWSQINYLTDIPSGSSYTYNVSNLADGNYTYRVQACNNYGSFTTCGGWRSSSLVSVINRPSIPSNLDVPSTSTTGKYTVSWNAASGNVTKYVLQEKLDGSGWTTVDNTTALSKAFTSKPNGNHQYKVQACNGAVCSSFTGAKAITVDIVAPWANTTASDVPDASFVEPSVPAQQNVGAVAGEGNVSGGTASYSIPIAIPPGRNAMQPSIGLSYSSRSGNSLAGMGWSLTGLSSIQRCGQTVAHDNGRLRGVQLDNDDRLCLDGQRLMVVNGMSYGANGAVYRTEQDSFARVTQSSALSSDTGSFVVELKNGRIRHYGSTANSRFKLGGSNVVHTWALSYEEDRSANSNSIHYQYDSFDDGEYHIADIYYTGQGVTQGNRRVHFGYDNTQRTDVSSRYVAGGLQRQTQRLKYIETYYGNSKVRDYTLRYAYSQATSRSLLQGVTECGYFGSGSTCLPETTFTWQDAPTTFTLEKLGYRDGSGGHNYEESDGSDIVPILQDKKILQDVLPHGDSNGDGTIDWPERYIDAEGMDGGSHSLALNYRDVCARNSINYQLVCFDADFNGDGRIDRWDIDNNTLKIAYSNNQWFNASIPFGPYDHIANIGDFNGDAWPDIVVYKSDASGNGGGLPNKKPAHLDLYVHTGNINQPYNSTGQRIYSYELQDVITTSVQYVGDMDGNGLQDFLELDNDVPNTQSAYVPSQQPRPRTLYLTQRSAGGTLSFTQVDLEDPAKAHLSFSNWEYFLHYIADINGDGLADWIAGTGNGNMLALNKGNGTFSEWQALGEGAKLIRRKFYNFDPKAQEAGYIFYPKYAASFRSFDYDGDGRAELLTPGELQIEACHSLLSSGKYKTFCGDELYGHQIPNASNPWVESPIPSDSFDDGIYRYDAIAFVEQADGTFTAVRKTTPLIGSAIQSTGVDTFGNGVQDFLFTYACRGSEVSADNCYTGDKSGPLANKSTGVYINRSRGSATGDERYAAPDMLVSVENGLGFRNEWTYRPLSSRDSRYHSSTDPFYAPDFDYLDQMGSTAKAAHFHFTSSMYVVAEHRYSDGIGGMSRTQYRYKGAIFNREGRGFQGFRTIYTEDVTANLKTQSDFHQVFPLAGKLHRTRAWVLDDLSNSAPFTESLYTWRFWPNNGKAGSYDKTVANLTDHWSVQAGTPYFVGTASLTAITRDLTTRNELYRNTKTYDFDIWGNAKTVTASYREPGDRHIVSATTTTEFTPDVNDWWLTKMSQTQVTKDSIQARNSIAIPADADRTHTVTLDYLEWDNALRLPKQVRTTPSSGRWSQVSTEYNDYGLPSQVTLSGQDEEPRVSNTFYSDDGYFPDILVNAVGHTQEVSTYPELGKPHWSEDVNNVRTTISYDALGRTLHADVDGTPRAHSRIRWCSNECPEQAEYEVHTYQAGQPKQVAYVDMMGRTILTQHTSFDGNPTYQRTEFDNLGRPSFASIPSFSSNTDMGIHYLDYDVLGRLTHKRMNQTDGQTLETSYTHSGFTTVITAGNLTLSRTYNGLKQLIQTTDAIGGETKYAYDGSGNPIVVEDANTHRIEAIYNALGQKESVNDPNMGFKSFTYTGFGEVKAETDANQNTTQMTYDSLGRPTYRHVNSSLEATWEYDLATNGIGLLYRESRADLGSNESFAKTYAYDPFSRVDRVTTNIDGQSFVTRPLYDSQYGRLKGMEYPTGLTLAYDYNAHGHRTSVRNAASDYVYQEITSVDARGQWRYADYAMGTFNAERDFHDTTGQMASTNLHNLIGELHGQVYSQYDIYGNLKSLTTEVPSLSPSSTTETFNYDDLHRLTANTRSNAADIHYDYDAVGNLVYKDDYASAYHYNGSKPNAVSSVTLVGGGSLSFGYDNNGNRTHEGGTQTLWYNAFNKPTQIMRNGTALHFRYGADQMRYKQINSTKSTTTLYVDKLYEKITNGSEIKHRYFIEDIAVLTRTVVNNIATPSIGFTHRDRLGSTIAIVDQNGSLQETQSYDPFGKPRAGNVLDKPQPILASTFTTRGFTDHEHLDAVQLIHMNGRGYDYNLGRFLSVDPVIQAPQNSQSLNPYSYIMNNPLSGTDPTGYTAEKDVKVEPVKEKVAVTGSRIPREKVVGYKVSGSITKGGVTATANLFVSTNGSVSGTLASSSSPSKSPSTSAEVSGQSQRENIGGASSAQQGSGGGSMDGATLAAGGAIAGRSLASTLATGGAASLADGPLPIGEAVLIGSLALLYGDDLAAAMSVLTDVEGLAMAANPMAGLGTGGMVSSGGALPPPDDDGDYTSQLRVSGTTARSNLVKSLGAGEGQAHHLIPWQMRSHPMVQQAARGGFNMNGARNGMRLRNHSFSRRHRTYNKIMRRLLDKEFRRNPGMTSRQAADKLHYYADRARNALNNSSRQLGKFK